MKLTKKQREAIASEIINDIVDEIGGEVDNSNCFAVDFERGGSVWMSVRILVPDLNIEERAKHNCGVTSK